MEKRDFGILVNWHVSGPAQAVMTEINRAVRQEGARRYATVKISVYYPKTGFHTYELGKVEHGSIANANVAAGQLYHQGRIDEGQLNQIDRVLESLAIMTQE